MLVRFEPGKRGRKEYKQAEDQAQDQSIRIKTNAEKKSLSVYCEDQCGGSNLSSRSDDFE
jgi:hypothetical protein